MAYPDEVMMSQYPAPAFDEPACKNHPLRAAVDPVAFRHCAECKERAQDAYVDAAIRAEKEKFYTGTQWDTDTSGAPLRGEGSREAGHKRHMQARKEKDE